MESLGLIITEVCYFSTFTQKNKKRRNEGMSEWINEGMNEWVNELMNEWRISEELMKEWRNEWMKQIMNEWRN